MFPLKSWWKNMKNDIQHVESKESRSRINSPWPVLLKHFLSQVLCPSYHLSQYNWHHWIGNCFMVKSIIKLIYFCICFLEIFANFYPISDFVGCLLFSLQWGAGRVDSAPYLKKEYLKNTVFFFGVAHGALTKYLYDLVWNIWGIKITSPLETFFLR